MSLALLLCAATARAAPDAPASSAVPATVAVAFDRHGVRPLLAEGLADRATGRRVTADDPVRVASISKLITALGVLRLVEAGQLELDRDVSAYLGWPLRNPAFPDRPITLRLLLSHRSSLTDGADYLVPLGETLRSRLADPRAWDPVHPPGSDWFHYTNLNFPVIAAVMERATGERFDRLMTRLVFAPLRLDACFNWSGCSPAAVRRAVVLYRAGGEVARDDLRGARPCPVGLADGAACDLAPYRPGDNGALFSPQGGLRIAMRGLARIGRMLARGGDGFLSPQSLALLPAPQWRLNGSNGLDEDGTATGLFCAYGLALQRLGEGGPGCHDGLFRDGRARLGHSGDAYGLRSGLWFDPLSGRGLVYFTTAVDPADRGRRSAFSAPEERLIDRLTGGTGVWP
ncbi:beta-lactamase family protein [Novosphingobium piscinae]|uniref:Beta-lactamase family protein n=2 Tax=Novosphingobium piscinae TaxID=1507448 RepID=A0A7X1KR44_9SPHN|nr:beta-lactamase family protein [Novosphingobium piscinae]